ncbi:hypothetical protein ABZV80_33455 [Streptomyces sp. NPDC005132]|uniref:hypothetical protein n=1 Tax=Streptomyces sp. NPDC005132 TaxID=3154294 RepID=UPI0033B0660B
MFAFVLGLAGGTANVLVIGLGAGLMPGLMPGLMEFLEDASPTDPRHPVRDDLAFGLSIVFVIGLAGGLGLGLSGGLSFGFGVGLAGGLAFGLYWLAEAGRRYLVFLCCVRGRLPWRLGTLLNWAYEKGLLRISGVAYQFRHRELQDWITAHPTP